MSGAIEKKWSESICCKSVKDHVYCRPLIIFFSGDIHHILQSII